jgi:DNA-binding NarL/FixJ family response regulator
MPDEGSARTRVLVGDSHAPTRAGLRLALERGGLSVCAEVDEADAAVEAAERERPQICLLDVRMFGGGIAAAARITAKLPEAAVVMLAAAEDELELFDALRAGASGYLLKDTDPDRVPAILCGVLRGEAALSRRLAARVIAEFRARGQRHLAIADAAGVTLTGREGEVLDLMLQGLETGDIAQRLYIAPGTVRTHVAAVLRKLHVSDREAALRLLRR